MPQRAVNSCLKSALRVIPRPCEQLPAPLAAEVFLTAFDLRSRGLVWEEAVPQSKLEEVWTEADIEPPPWEMMDCLPLDEDQARNLAAILGRRIEGSEAFYFLDVRTWREL